MLVWDGKNDFPSWGPLDDEVRLCLHNVWKCGTIVVGHDSFAEPQLSPLGWHIVVLVADIQRALRRARSGWRIKVL
jgi:hypothetical protein